MSASESGLVLLTRSHVRDRAAELPHHSTPGRKQQHNLEWRHASPGLIAAFAPAER